MIKRVKVVSVIVGLIGSQVVSFTMAIFLVIAFLLLCGNSVLVAFFEYPSSIAITLFLTLLGVATGGYIAMAVAKEGMINPFLVGLVSLVLNAWLMHYTEYVYAANHPWLLIVAATLIVPASVGGGYLYQWKSS